MDPLTRREFLGQAGALFWGLPAGAPGARTYSTDGAVDTGKLGVTLIHEHLLVDFIGAEQVSRSRYDPEEVFRTCLPYLERIRKLGCRTFVDCTPAWLGRDPQLLARLAKASRVRIITNTGYYGAAGDKHVPRHAYLESAGQLAGRWIAEFREGIEGTPIRPGFIKIGVDRDPLSEIDAKLVHAAALAHRATGLTIASHTGNGPAALEQVEILKREGVSAEAFIWVHAQNEKQVQIHVELAARGAWLEFDGIRDSSLARHRDLVVQLKEKGYLHRLLISQDAGWYRVGEPRGGAYRDYDLLFAQFVPALRGAGFTEKQVRQLLVDNPARALAIRPRLL